MNTDLLRDVRDHIATEPEHFDMDSYFHDDMNLAEGQSAPLPAACGTTACIAGWAATLCGRYEARGTAFGNWGIAPVGGDSTTFFLAGAESLGITNKQAERLFYRDQWPEHYREMEFEETQAKAAVSLLDDILDGLTVWDDERGWVYLPDDVVADEEVTA
jgi:hypothetical protein